MYVMFCEAGDHAALRCARSIRQRLSAPLRIVTPEEITYSADIVHHVSSDTVSGSIAMLSGDPLEYGRIYGAVNRLSDVPVAHLDAFVPEDRDYVLQEMRAILASWIYGLPCRVANRPSAGSLGGPYHPPAVQMALAAEAGLPVPDDLPEPDAALPSGLSAVVIGERVLCDRRLSAHREALRRFAERAGLDIVEVIFADGPDGPVFSSAHARAALPPASGDAIAAFFSGRLS